MSRNVGRGSSGGVNRNYGGNSGKGRGGGGGQTGSNSFVNNSSNVRYQTGNYYNNTNYKSNYYDNPIVKLSKALSSVLRHNAIEQGLKIRPDGYVKVDELIRLPRFRNTKFEDIQRVVKDNDKQRFNLIEKKSESGESIWWIKANQGHSLEVKDLELEPITDPSEIPQIIHGTFFRSWEQIKLQGLSKMGRNHIHFAVGRFGEANVISGMRKSCDVFIYVNVSKAMKENIKFSKSANGVILTEGINGILDKKYFLKVIDKYNTVLYETSSEDNNNNNVTRNDANKNVEGNNVGDVKSTDGNNVNNKNVDGNKTNTIIDNVNENNNDNKKGDDDNKRNNNANNASGNVNPKIMSPGSTNDNKGNSVWNGSNANIKNPSGTNNNSAWNGSNTKIMKISGTTDNKGNNNVRDNNNPKSTNDNNNRNVNISNENVNRNNTNDNGNKIVQNNNRNVNNSSGNVNRNNDNDNRKSDNNKRKNDNNDNDKGKRVVFSYADMVKKR